MDIIKAIFLDMDGTILHEDNTASGYTKEVIDQLRAKGIRSFLLQGVLMLKLISLFLKDLQLMVS